MKIFIHSLTSRIYYVCNDINDIKRFTTQEYEKIKLYCIKHNIYIDICTEERLMNHKKKTSNYNENYVICINR